MKCEVSFKLCDCAIPHTKPIRCVPHAMQQPLNDELDKLCKQKILHKVDISKPFEWFNSFACVKIMYEMIGLCLESTHLNKWIIHPMTQC